MNTSDNQLRLLQNLLRKKRYPIVVRYLNPTTNKALHIGHIRNATLGSATAACLSKLGLHVAKHCILEDVGPHMAFAIYGRKRSIALGRQLVEQIAKPDHQAHAYYMYGRKLCTPPSRRGRDSSTRLRRQSSIDVSRALVPERVLREWLLGSPEASAVAEMIKSLALRGQSETLENFGIEFDYRDFESAESSYVSGFVDLGLAAGVFRRLRDNSVVFRFGRQQVLLRYAMGAPHESAYLLCFMQRCLNWKKPEWVHIAFAGQEWASTMRLYPQLLQSAGVAKATTRYFVIFHGMVTFAGEKMASRSGQGMLADDLFTALESLPQVGALISNSKQFLSAREAVRLLVRLALLEVRRGRDIEFSVQSLCDRNGTAWRIVQTLSSACMLASAHWSTFGTLKESTEDYRRVAKVALAASQHLSFEGPLNALGLPCERVLSDLCRGKLEPIDLCEIATHLSFLGLNVPPTVRRLDGAPSLLGGE